MPDDPRQLYLARRVELFRQLLADRNLDGYFVYNLSDLVYFTDFRSEGYYGLMGVNSSWLFTPNLLFDQVRAKTDGFFCLKGRFFPALKKVTAKSKMKRLAFDPGTVPYGMGVALRKLGFEPVAGLVAQLRALKDELELKRLRAANHLAAEGAAFVKGQLKPGRTEKRIAADLAHFFDIHGDGISFELIIAGGPNSAFPHHVSSEYKLRKGDPVICDIGGLWEGYHSDLTRTYTLGTISGAFSRVYKIVEKAQKEGIKRLRPGVTAGSVDAASRRVIRQKGFGPQFVHSTGHGVGLDIHEDPRIGPGSKDRLREGMVVTVEPGIYLPGKFGVRIEDTLIVTSSGSELITR